jgi:hypothetical protein
MEVLMKKLNNKLVLVLVAALLATPFMGAQELNSDACIEAFRPCVEATKTFVEATKPSYWNNFVSGLAGAWNATKGYVQSIDTAKVQATVKEYGTSCVEAIKKDPKKAGMCVMVAVVGSYIVYKLLTKMSKKGK